MWDLWVSTISANSLQHLRGIQCRYSSAVRKPKYGGWSLRQPSDGEDPLQTSQRTLRKAAHTFPGSVKESPETKAGGQGWKTPLHCTSENDVVEGLTKPTSAVPGRATIEISALRTELGKRRERIRDLRDRLARLELAECRSASIERRAQEQKDRLDKALKKWRSPKGLERRITTKKM